MALTPGKISTLASALATNNTFFEDVAIQRTGVSYEGAWKHPCCIFDGESIVVRYPVRLDVMELSVS